WTEGREQLARVLALPGAEARTAARGKALNAAGALAYQQGDYGAARALYEEGLAIGRELKDNWVIGASLNSLGLVANEQGDYEAARRLLDEALDVAREAGHPV